MAQEFKRWDLINYLIQKFNYKSYLEIGVQSGMCISQIQCAKKLGVDPDKTSQADLFMTSDDYFKQTDEMFDIIFIDGLHEGSQVYRDINNALDHLNEGGVIICHDMLPATREAEHFHDFKGGYIWNGDCWKAFAKLRAEETDLAIATIDSDHGLGVVMVGKQDNISVPADVLDSEGYVDIKKLKWGHYSRYRSSWMNIISKETFFSICDRIKK